MNGLSIFMYHQVGNFPRMRTHRASYCDVGRFRAQMRALKWLGVEVLSMTDAARALRGEMPIPPRAAVLTFDDGCRNFLDHALPVLEEHGFPAIVYAIAGMVGGRADWLSTAGHEAAPLMTWAELREIQRRGIEIGSHSLHHIRLGEQDRIVQEAELRESKALLQDKLGTEITHMCYPYGSVGIETLHVAASAGYETGVTCQRAKATPAFDLLALPRKAISYGDNTLGFAWKLFMKDRPKQEALRRSQT